MAKCEICGKKPQVGNNISHAHNVSKRRFLPNLQRKRFWSHEEKRWVTLTVSARGIRTISKKGIDVVLREMRTGRTAGLTRRQLIRRSIGAAVALWSVANETPISEARNAFLKALVDRVRELDDTRLVTAALERGDLPPGPTRDDRDRPGSDRPDGVGVSDEKLHRGTRESPSRYGKEVAAGGAPAGASGAHSAGLQFSGEAVQNWIEATRFR